jgi:hypothetical protein
MVDARGEGHIVFNRANTVTVAVIPFGTWKYIRVYLGCTDIVLCLCCQ